MITNRYYMPRLTWAWWMSEEEDPIFEIGGKMCIVMSDK